MSRRAISVQRLALRVAAGVTASLLLLSAACTDQPRETLIKPPPTIAAPHIDLWKQAARLVEADRDGATGRTAQVAVPLELKHYSDRRRFLAVQVAEWRKQNIQVAHDFAELIALVERGDLVEMPPLGDAYLLYGVGASAGGENLSHYDRFSGLEIPLFGSYEEFLREDGALNESISELQLLARDIQAESRKTPKPDLNRRRALAARLKETRKSVAAETRRRNAIRSFYTDQKLRKMLISEQNTLTEFASRFGDKSYDLTDPSDRKLFRMRLLSFIRPEARDAILEIAAAYKSKFDRHLPITSLIRTESYQRHLSESNPNATRIGVPPHTTGLAFDVYYHYMSAEEQDYLMSSIARMKAEGRIEALRETRDHIHVFAFIDGTPPSEQLISHSLQWLRTGKLPRPTSARPAGAATTATRANDEVRPGQAGAPGLASKD